MITVLYDPLNLTYSYSIEALLGGQIGGNRVVSLNVTRWFRDM